MALTVVNLTDTFDEWRIKTNTLGTNTGDLTTLSTTAKGTLVAAINEIFSNDSDDMENVVDDTSPELGGDLVLNGNDITGTGNINTTGGLILSGTANAAIVASEVFTGAAPSITSTASSNGNITITPDGTGNVVITKGDYTGSLNTATTGTTQTAGNNSTLIATTGFVHSVVASEDTLAEDNDVTISSPQNLDVLQYNSSSSVWENTAMVTQSAGNNSTLIATTAFVHSVVASEDTLFEMNDTTISNPQNLDILQYTGSVWENHVLTAVSIDDATALAIALG